MFGVVPKPLWEKRAPADDRNRIPLGLRPLLVRGDEDDAHRRRASATRWTRRARHLRHRSRAATSIDSLADAGVARERHRHRARDAPALRSRRRVHDARRRRRVVPALSARALRRPDRGEWEDATHPHERNRASYLPENFVPLQEAGVLRVRRRTTATIMPGVRVVRTGGHTMHHQIVLHRVRRPDGGLRRRPDADDRARRRAVDHGLRPVSDGHAGVQDARSSARRSSAST